MPTRIATAIMPYTELEVADGNFDKSRVVIDRVIIHTMVGTVQGAAARFDTYGTQVSSHYGIGLDGKLYHWLEEYWTAYHAGSYSMNQRSIGIEHEDNGDYNGVRPDTLYATSAKLVRDICQFYGIPIDRQHILKHSEVIPTGCPDALDIDRIVREAVNPVSPSSSKSPSVSPSSSASSSMSPSNSASNSLSPSPSVSPSPSPSAAPDEEKLQKLSVVIKSKWTWFGTNGWKNKLQQLKNILDA